MYFGTICVNKKYLTSQKSFPHYVLIFFNEFIETKFQDFPRTTHTYRNIYSNKHKQKFVIISKLIVNKMYFKGNF